MGILEMGQYGYGGFVNSFYGLLRISYCNSFWVWYVSSKTGCTYWKDQCQNAIVLVT